MSRVLLHPDDQIRRINLMEDEITQICSTHKGLLDKRPGVDKWCVLEVIDHMTRAHRPYYVKLNDALKHTANVENSCFPYQPGWMKSWMFRSFSPQDEGLIKYKMKTMKIFEPRDSSKPGDSIDVDLTLKEFRESLAHLKSVAHESRYKSINGKRFGSAIGPVVRFNITEGVEFMLRHNERHMQQIRNVLSVVS